MSLSDYINWRNIRKAVVCTGGAIGAFLFFQSKALDWEMIDSPLAAEETLTAFSLACDMVGYCLAEKKDMADGLQHAATLANIGGKTQKLFACDTGLLDVTKALRDVAKGTKGANLCGKAYGYVRGWIGRGKQKSSEAEMGAGKGLKTEKELRAEKIQQLKKKYRTGKRFKRTQADFQAERRKSKGKFKSPTK